LHIFVAHGARLKTTENSPARKGHCWRNNDRKKKKKEKKERKKEAEKPKRVYLSEQCKFRSFPIINLSVI
jgi:hypothetical protein